jgi:intein-encoded DNA endonuclease-like protein
MKISGTTASIRIKISNSNNKTNTTKWYQAKKNTNQKKWYELRAEEADTKIKWYQKTGSINFYA